MDTNNHIEIGDTIRLWNWAKSITFRVTGETPRSYVGAFSTRGIEDTYEECCEKDHDWIIVSKSRPELPPMLDRWASVYADRVGAPLLGTAEEVALYLLKKTLGSHPGVPDLLAVARYTATDIRWIGADGELEA